MNVDGTYHPVQVGVTLTPDGALWSVDVLLPKSEAGPSAVVGNGKTLAAAQRDAARNFARYAETAAEPRA